MPTFARKKCPLPTFIFEKAGKSGCDDEKWPKKVAICPLLQNKSGHEKSEKWAKNGQKQAILVHYSVKNAIFEVSWPFAHFYFYLIAKKK